MFMFSTPSMHSLLSPHGGQSHSGNELFCSHDYNLTTRGIDQKANNLAAKNKLKNDLPFLEKYVETKVQMTD